MCVRDYTVGHSSLVWEPFQAGSDLSFSFCVNAKASEKTNLKQPVYAVLLSVERSNAWSLYFNVLLLTHCPFSLFQSWLNVIFVQIVHKYNVSSIVRVHYVCQWYAKPSPVKFLSICLGSISLEFHVGSKSETAICWWAASKNQPLHPHPNISILPDNQETVSPLFNIPSIILYFHPLCKLQWLSLILFVHCHREGPFQWMGLLTELYLHVQYYYLLINTKNIYIYQYIYLITLEVNYLSKTPAH